MTPLLSIAMPSHGVDRRTISNVFSVSLLAGEDIEVVVRDNSVNTEKRRELSALCQNGSSILFVDECGGEENVAELMKTLRGEFVLLCCDDDILNPSAIPAMISEIRRIRNDPEFIGTTGNFIKEEMAGSQYICFNSLDRPTAISRFHGYFPEKNHAIFQYSPIRRSVMNSVWDVLSSLPIRLSYDDILTNCLFLMSGGFTYIDRLFYIYSNKNWENEEASTKSDARFLRASGLDSSAVCVTWLIAMLEGALLFTSKTPKMAIAAQERLQLAEHWVREWWPFFLFTSARRSPDGRFERQAVALAEKWKIRQNLDLAELLADLVTFFSLSSPEVAERYYAFWK